MASKVDKPKYWQKTPEANLLRNAASGRYYARFIVSKKSKWVNLDTEVYSVAKLRLADERAKVERTRLAQKNADSGVADMGELARILRAEITSDATIGESTRELKLGVVAMVFRTWPELEKMKPDAVIRSEVLRWRDRLAREGTGHVLPGAKGPSELADGSSPSRINKGIDAIRALLDIAADRGQIGANPLSGRRRGIKLPMKVKKPDLPESSVLEKIFADMEKRTRPSAELCRFVAYTGCRLSEAAGVAWSDVDFGRGVLRVRGTKTDSSDREVPLIPAARALLETIRQRRAESGFSTNAGDRVLLVTEAGIALRKSCENVGAPRLTHHDLRDAFATACIEAGVDIPTIAGWLGHVDGGALLMRVYAHHRRAHSLSQAAKVKFGGAS